MTEMPDAGCFVVASCRKRQAKTTAIITAKNLTKNWQNLMRRPIGANGSSGLGRPSPRRDPDHEKIKVGCGLDHLLHHVADIRLCQKVRMPLMMRPGRTWMIGLRSSLRRIGLVALISLMVLQNGLARAEDAPPPQPQSTPAPGPARPGPGGNRAASTPSSPSTAEQHKLPPDSTTKQTVELPGRTLAFTATAGSIRLFDDKGEPQADIAYTSYQLDGTDRAKRPVTFLFNGGPGASSAYLQLGNAGPWRLPINADNVTPSSAPELQPNAGHLARFHRSRLHRSGRHRLQPLRRDWRGRAQAVLLGRRRRQFTRAGDPPLAGEERPSVLAEICHRRELWRHSRSEGRAQSADGAGRRRQGPDPDLAAAGFPRIFRHQPAAICCEPAELCCRGAPAKGGGHQGRSRRCRALCRHRFPARPHQGRGRHGRDQPRRRQGGRADRHRSGGQPPARRPLRHQRIPPRVRSTRGQGDRPL